MGVVDGVVLIGYEPIYVCNFLFLVVFFCLCLKGFWNGSSLILI